jgi:hypothetical protein
MSLVSTTRTCCRRVRLFATSCSIALNNLVHHCPLSYNAIIFSCLYWSASLRLPSHGSSRELEIPRHVSDRNAAERSIRDQKSLSFATDPTAADRKHGFSPCLNRSSSTAPSLCCLSGRASRYHERTSLLTSHSAIAELVASRPNSDFEVKHLALGVKRLRTPRCYSSLID